VFEHEDDLALALMDVINNRAKRQGIYSRPFFYLILFSYLIKFLQFEGILYYRDPKA